MRIGLISDTHGTLRPRVFDHFEGVELILHAGDIGLPAILTELESVAPVSAVWGNTDGFDIRQVVQETVELEIDGRKIVMMHGHQLGSPTPAALHAAHPQADIIVFGHTHRPTVERLGDTLVVNPGGAGAPRFGLKPTVALLDIESERNEVRIIEL